MAIKRAEVDAALRLPGVARFFTQDLEDIMGTGQEDDDGAKATSHEVAKAPERAAPRVANPSQGGRTPSPRPVPPGSSDSPTLTRAQLEDTLTAENMPWDRFELEVLRTSWATFLKTKGASPAVALAKWEAWKNSHPQAQEAPTAPPAGATAPRG